MDSDVKNRSIFSIYRMAEDAMRVLETVDDDSELETDGRRAENDHARLTATHHEAKVARAMQNARHEVKARLQHQDRSTWLEIELPAKPKDTFIPKRFAHARQIQAFQAPTTTVASFALLNRSASYLGCVAAVPGHRAGTARQCTCVFCKNRSAKSDASN
ncbi:MAG: hypothetical protein H7Z43_09450 [Clostridia bacterium]|nr:hypothetical protein [Deltaproteobacteria bacterium]